MLSQQSSPIRRIAILGSTGSVGTRALEVLDALPHLLQAEVLTAHSNARLLVEQARKYQPNAVVITDESKYSEVKDALSSLPVKVFAGQQALNEVVSWDSVDVVLAAILGYAGLKSTLAAVRAGKLVALANKETLVAAGEQVMTEAWQHKARVVPVDSEHSAIFQCLAGEDLAAVEKMILTASGGPFLGRKSNYLVNVKASHALQHPIWNIGAKAAIDSASMMNKGLEMIEAKWLFGMENDQVEVLIHPQGVVHSMVQFRDGSLKAQLGLPDMKLPIQYALCWPNRAANEFKRLDFKNYAQLNFEAPDIRTFRNLSLAREAMLKGGNMPAILNAANEVVVAAFLKNRIGFLEMSDVIGETMEKITHQEKVTLDDLEADDALAREVAAQLIEEKRAVY